MVHDGENKGEWKKDAKRVRAPVREGVEVLK